MKTDDLNNMFQPRTPVKLIFNPGSGSDRQSPVQLMDVIAAMQQLGFVPEPFLIHPGCNLRGAVREALQKSTRLFVACGGDGTVSSVARELYGQRATLGIIPTGTQNNVAFSLGIPFDIQEAIALLRYGRLVRADMGLAECGRTTLPFLEVCSVGLISTLFPASDDIQHGHFLRIGDFFASLISSPPASIRLVPEDGQEIHRLGHVLLVSNMPYVIRRFKVGTPACYRDGLLDVLLFGGLSKLEMMGYAIRGNMEATRSDRRIQHLRAASIEITTSPLMPVMADGLMLGDGPLRITVARHSLSMIAKKPPVRSPRTKEEAHE